MIFFFLLSLVFLIIILIIFYCSPKYSFQFCEKSGVGWIPKGTICSEGPFLNSFLKLPYRRRCSTLAPRFFVSEFWVCCRVLSLYQTFHAHTTMLNVHSRSAIIFFVFFIPVLLNERFSENHNYRTRRSTDFVHSLFSSLVNSVDAIFLYIFFWFS